MSVSDEQSWPLTPEGLTDWEVAFEDPDKGFIALITQANTPAALRQCTIVVIEKLCARHNDPAEVERFKSGLIQLVPDDTPDEDLLRITGAVTVILRQIKDDRILKAVEYAKDREQGRSTGGRRAEDKKSPRHRGLLSGRPWLGALSPAPLPPVWRGILFSPVRVRRRN